MKISGIYRVLNKINGKMYIGSAVNIKKRWAQHRRDLRGNKHHSQYLQNSWAKYGEENFVFEVILDVEDKNNLIKWEQVWMDALKPEYNMCKVAGSCLGIKASDETRAKLSAVHKGRVLSDEHKAKMSAAQKGKVISEEHKAKLSAAAKGRVISAETKAKLSAAQKGNTNGVGYKHSEENKAKISAAQEIKLKATRADGLIIYFKSYQDAAKSGFWRTCICAAIKKNQHYKDFRWEYV